MPTSEKIATNPTIDGLKKSIARYWCTSAGDIGIDGEGRVSSAGDVITNFYALPHLGGFKFVYMDKG